MSFIDVFPQHMEFIGLALLSGMFLILLGLQSLFTLDDLFLDLCAVWFSLKPKELSSKDLRHMSKLREKRIAIVIANWKEDEILYQVVSGNLDRLKYLNYTVFIGVYPNDEKTWAVARALEAQFQRVQVIVNPKHGPTSKGQLLNVMTDHLVQYNSQFPENAYDLLLLQDSEDIIHPLSLQVFNQASQKADFIQIPVFSFSRRWQEMIGSTYMDEFSESHTKDLLVRQKLGAAIPSCGVGTALSMRLVNHLRQLQNGQLLSEKTLTEDYQLGLLTHMQGYKTLFVCLYQKTKTGIDWIATREYFPNQYTASVKQKTRWTLGIAFQGTQNIGWRGSIANKYFLFRDRKGPLNSLLLLLSSLYLCIFSFTLIIPSVELPSIMNLSVVRCLLMMNLAHMCFRIFQRSLHVGKVYAWPQALLAIARWPLGNWINCVSGLYAAQKQIVALRTKTLPKWDKTHHQIPVSFGQRLPTPGLSQGSVKTAMESER